MSCQKKALEITLPLPPHDTLPDICKNSTSLRNIPRLKHGAEPSLGFICEFWGGTKRDSPLEQPARPRETSPRVHNHQYPRAILSLVEGSCGKGPFCPCNTDSRSFPAAHTCRKIRAMILAGSFNLAK